MLEKLLSEIRAGGTFETRDLAARLDTTPELVEAMLGHLQRAGHIQPYRTCEDACSGCDLHGECGRPQMDGSPKKEVLLFTLVDPQSIGSGKDRH